MAGNYFEINDFIVFSRNEETARLLCGKDRRIVLDMIESGTGLAMISAALRSNIQHEEVVLLKPGRFRILRVTDDGSTVRVVIEELAS